MSTKHAIPTLSRMNMNKKPVTIIYQLLIELRNNQQQSLILRNI